MEEIESGIKSYILEQFLPNTNPDELTGTTPLIEGGILDSLATVRLVTYLEERFGIDVAAHEVNAENLGTLTSIAAMVRLKQAKTE